jgi:hypothetical protein
MLFLFFLRFAFNDFKSDLCVPSQDTMLFIFFMRFQLMIDFKSVLCVPSQDTMLFIFCRRFQFMILNQGCVFHLRILWHFYFFGVFNS